MALKNSYLLEIDDAERLALMGALLLLNKRADHEDNLLRRVVDLRPYMLIRDPHPATFEGFPSTFEGA